MTEIRDIPLHQFHAAKGARFVDFGGWNMPVQYTSILEEHTAVREAAGLFDVSHMGEFLVKGPGAGAFLDRLVTNKIASAPAGKAVYSPMCAQDGTVVDDLIVYKIADDDFLVCVNASNIDKDFQWFSQHLDEWGLEATLTDASDDYALLAIQGPAAVQIIEAAGISDAVSLKRFAHTTAVFEGSEIRICRTGYTGEDGFEIYVAPSAAEALAEKLTTVGTPLGLKLCGLGARDSLRLEAGLPLYGHELSDAISPIEAGLAWTVKFTKDTFNGRDALLTQKENGTERSVVHFQLAGRRIARQGTAVVDAEANPVGEVLSGTLSPVTGSPIGSALVESAAIERDALRVDLRGNLVDLQTKKPPLHK